jgi:hypothetical protein
VGNIKVPIVCYDYSNNNNFFFVITNDGKFKIFHIYGAFNESKLACEVDLGNLNAHKGSLYVTSGDSSRVQGFIAYSSNYSIYIREVENIKVKSFENVVDSEIIGVKLISYESKLFAVVATRDGKFTVVDIEITA